MTPQPAPGARAIDRTRMRWSARSTATYARDWRLRLPFFYGWVIVAGSLIVLGLTYSVMYSFSVFYVALLEEFGWGRGEAAGV